MVIFNSYVKLPEGTGESPWISYWKCHVLQLYRLFLYKKLDRPWTDHGQITTFHETKIPMVKSPWNLDFGWYSKSCSFMISYHFFSIFWYIRKPSSYLSTCFMICLLMVKSNHSWKSTCLWFWLQRRASVERCLALVWKFQSIIGFYIQRIYGSNIFTYTIYVRYILYIHIINRR